MLKYSTGLENSNMAAQTLPRVLTLSHWIVGGITLIVFLGEGIYMLEALGGLEQTADGPRMLYRSAHIYTLLAGVANILCAYNRIDFGKLRPLAILACIPILLSPALFTLGFFIESQAADLNRTIIATSLFCVFGSAVVLWLLGLKNALGLEQ